MCRRILLENIMEISCNIACKTIGSRYYILYMSIADSGNASITHFFSTDTLSENATSGPPHNSIYAAPFFAKCFDPDFPDVGICEFC